MNRLNRHILKTLWIFLPGLLISHGAMADSAGGTAGLIIQQSNTPRPNALGDAFASVTDDIAAQNFNPASLGSLQGSQLSLQRQQGSFDDAFSQVAFGSQIAGGALGFSASLFDSGTAELFDGTNTKSVTAERDTLINLGYGYHFGFVDVGGNIRYLTSTLAEESKATGSTGDLGLNFPVTSKIRLGVAGTVYASKINYQTQEETLPKVYRVGASFKSDMGLLGLSHTPILLLADAPYSTAEKDFFPSIGLEVLIAEPLALRAGYKFNQGVQGLTVGFGFFVRDFSVDYSFGVVSENQLDSLHTLGISMRFKNGLFSREKEMVGVPVQERAEANTNSAN